MKKEMGKNKEEKQKWVEEILKKLPKKMDWLVEDVEPHIQIADGYNQAISEITEIIKKETICPEN